MSTLEECVQEWIDEKKEEGYESAVEDLLQYGCQSGIVSGLIYYADTIPFYEEHKEEINELLKELIDSTDMQPAELFGDKWDKTDPLALETQNQNLLAWFAFEETAGRLTDYLNN